MRVTDLDEPNVIRHAVMALALQASFFGIVLFSGAISWGGGAPVTPVMQVSLIPLPPAPPPAEPEPASEPEPAPEPEADAAEKERLAEVVRAEEKRKEEEERKREQERKEKEAREREEEKKREEQKKRDEEERKRKEKEKRDREAAEAAAEAAARKALAGRASRVEGAVAGRIKQRVENFLNTPVSVPDDPDIEVKVYVRLNADGSLNGFPEVIESSGFPEFDEAAVKAVLKAAPLPMPTGRREAFVMQDEEFRKRFIEHTLIITPN